MRKQKCPKCEFEMKDLRDLFRQIKKDLPQVEFYWCPFCGVLQDINAVDTSFHKPLIFTPKKARISLVSK